MKMNWQNTQWNSGVSLQNKTDETCFDFPIAPGHVNSITARRGAYVPKSTITIHYRIKTLSGMPVFRSLDKSPVPPGFAPNFRVMIQRSDLNDRWWPAGAQCAFLVADGTEKIYAVTLAPAQWSDVSGQYNAKAFKSVVRSPGEVAIVFGGGNSFSHGVSLAAGKARFELISFSVTTP